MVWLDLMLRISSRPGVLLISCSDFHVARLSTNQAQQATRAMLRRANNNHEPEGFTEDPEASGEEDKHATGAKSKGTGKGKSKGKPKAKAKGKAKAKAKAKAKTKARADTSSDKEEENSCEKEKPKQRGRSLEKSRGRKREVGPEVPAKKPKAEAARSSSSKPARKREPSRSPNPDSIWDSPSETEPRKNKKLRPLKKSKSEERRCDLQAKTRRMQGKRQQKMKRRIRRKKLRLVGFCAL